MLDIKPTTYDGARLVCSEESIHAWHGTAIAFKVTVQRAIDQFIEEEEGDLMALLRIHVREFPFNWTLVNQMYTLEMK